jgi:septum formation topological specificity factor MinE
MVHVLQEDMLILVCRYLDVGKHDTRSKVDVSSQIPDLIVNVFHFFFCNFRTLLMR